MILPVALFILPESFGFYVLLTDWNLNYQHRKRHNLRVLYRVVF